MALRDAVEAFNRSANDALAKVIVSPALGVDASCCGVGFLLGLKRYIELSTKIKFQTTIVAIHDPKRSVVDETRDVDVSKVSFVPLSSCEGRDSGEKFARLVVKVCHSTVMKERMKEYARKMSSAEARKDGVRRAIGSIFHDPTWGPVLLDVYGSVTTIARITRPEELTSATPLPDVAVDEFFRAFDEPFEGRIAFDTNCS